MSPAERIQRLNEDLNLHLNQIATYFNTPVSITLVVRNPDHPDGSRDVVCTNDSLDSAIRAIGLRQAAAPSPEPTAEGREAIPGGCAHHSRQDSFRTFHSEDEHRYRRSERQVKCEACGLWLFPEEVGAAPEPTDTGERNG